MSHNSAAPTRASRRTSRNYRSHGKPTHHFGAILGYSGLLEAEGGAETKGGPIFVATAQRNIATAFLRGEHVDGLSERRPGNTTSLVGSVDQ
jgi:hypothetical protein